MQMMLYSENEDPLLKGFISALFENELSLSQEEFIYRLS